MEGRQTSVAVALATVLAWLAGVGGAGAAVVVVSSEGLDGAAPGHRIVGWQVADRTGGRVAEGAAEHPLALDAIRTAEAPRGAFRLVLADGSVTAELDRTASLVVRPELSDDERRLHSRARSAAQDAAPELWRDLARRLEERGCDPCAAWALAAAGSAADDDQISADFGQARRLVGGEPPVVAHLLRREAAALRRIGAPPELRRALLEQALGVDRDHDPMGQAVATDLLSLARLNLYGASPRTAEELAREALRLHEAANPDSLEVAEALLRLGLAVAQLGRQDEALALARRRLELVERIAGPDVERVRARQTVGSFLWKMGRTREAARELEAARRLAERTPAIPVGILATIEATLASVAFDRGDMVLAERHARRSVELAADVDEAPAMLPNHLNTLATIQNERYDYTGAEATLARTIELYESLAPKSRNLAMALNNRANNARQAGDLEQALGLVERAREMILGIAPESLTAANSRAIRAQILSARGDPLSAADEMRAALDAARRQYDGSERVARKATQLAGYLRRAGRLTEARALLAEAVAIYELRTPGVTQHARALHGLGEIDRQQDRRDDATRRLCAAVDLVDRQRIGIGFERLGSGGFSRDFAGYHHDCSEGLVAQDRTEEAFGIVERGRARDLLALLAERQLALPPESPELLERRDSLNRRYDLLYERLATTQSAADSAHLAGELDRLRQEQYELETTMRAVDSRSAVVYPQPLSFEETLGALDPGTVLLSFSLGEERSRAYVLGRRVGPRGIATYSLEIRGDSLDALVGDLRRAIARRGDHRMAARRLWDLLLAPAEPWLATADRLLISPEGSLHYLPFAALLDGQGRFLIERLPVHVVTSMTVRQQLRHERGGTASDQLVAFGDPEVSGSKSSHRIDSAVRSGLELAALPETRREVEAIVDLFPSSAHAYLGAAATETRFKAVAPSAGRVHLATHGYLDHRSPLDSGVLLSPEGDGELEGENGILQAWEIFEELKLHADLVTLSACESALGQEAAGEGMIGLTRALQYAGAPSIVASLWRVADASTADLMIDFYGGMKDGLSKDEALRRAQMAVLESEVPAVEDDGARGVGGLAPTAEPGRRHPYWWAAFVLIGDWR